MLLLYDCNVCICCVDAAGIPPAVPGTSQDPDATASGASSVLRKGGDDTTHLPDATTASTLRDQTTLIPNESEAFALEPIDVTTLGEFNRQS
jgi:hypothetical protein